jgi:hypothetical protein
MVAAFGSIGGVIWVARFGQRSEHHVWQRNLRERLYGECAVIADGLAKSMVDANNALTDELAMRLSDKAAEVEMFGSVPVRLAVAHLRFSALSGRTAPPEERTKATMDFRDKLKDFFG